jgi:hypothetical protein
VALQRIIAASEERTIKARNIAVGARLNIRGPFVVGVKGRKEGGAARAGFRAE